MQRLSKITKFALNTVNGRHDLCHVREELDRSTVGSCMNSIQSDSHIKFAASETHGLIPLNSRLNLPFVLETPKKKTMIIAFPREGPGGCLYSTVQFDKIAYVRRSVTCNLELLSRAAESTNFK